MTGIGARTPQSVNNDTAASTYTISKPAGVVSGDVLIALIGAIGATPAFTAPSGWTLIGTEAGNTNARFGAWYKVAGGSEPSTYAWTLGSTFKGFGWIGAYTGVDNTTPIDVSADNNTTNLATAPPAATLVHANAWLITAAIGRHAFAAARSMTTSDASDANRYAHGSSSASGFDYVGGVWDSNRDLTAGAASRTITVNTGTENVISWWAIGLKPAANNITGTAAATLGALTGAATGQRQVNGSGAATLGALTGTATGKRTVTATATAPTGALTGAATGQRQVNGSGAAALGALTGTATGKRTVTATAVAPTGALTGTAIGVRTVIGVAAATLGPLAGAAIGHREVTGSGAAALGALTGAAAGVRTVIGTAAANLGPLTGSGTQYIRLTSRPDIGSTSRPGSGATVRPDTGITTRPNAGTTARPDTGTTTRP